MSSKTPLYPRLLRLRHVKPNAWQRAALGEGALALAAVLVLADVATAWTLLVLPLAVAALVKLHDVTAGWLAPAGSAEEDEDAHDVEGAAEASDLEAAGPEGAEEQASATAEELGARRRSA